jgi:hypothetical protein
MDHSILTAKPMFETLKWCEIEDSIWSINAEEEFHEEIFDK